MHNYAYAFQLLGINAVFFKKIINISTVATKFACQPNHTLAISFKSFFQYLSNVHMPISVYNNIILHNIYTKISRIMLKNVKVM